MRYCRHLWPNAVLIISTALGTAACFGGASEDRANRTATDSTGARPGSQNRAAEQAAGRGAPLVAAPMGRVVVAKVNGVPVYGDCVATQAATSHNRPDDYRQARSDAQPDDQTDRQTGRQTDRRQEALARCIEFEVLAQEAAARGLATDPEVRWTQKVEAVRKLIDHDFTARFPDPDSMDPALLQAAYQKFQRRYQRPEVRQTAHVLVQTENIPPDSPPDQKARALIDEIYAALMQERDLTSATLANVARETAGDRAITVQAANNVIRNGRYVKPYTDTTFAIPEPGMVSAPVRTQFGWHIILLTRIDPGINVPLEEAKSELFAYQRQQQFAAWLARMVKSENRRARIWIDNDALAYLQAAEADLSAVEPAAANPSAPASQTPERPRTNPPQ